MAKMNYYYETMAVSTKDESILEAAKQFENLVYTGDIIDALSNKVRTSGEDHLLQAAKEAEDYGCYWITFVYDDFKEES